MKAPLKTLFVATLSWGGVSVLSGCALLFGKKYEEVQIQSDPPGATVFQDGVQMGETPITLTYSKRRVPVVVLEKENYLSTRVQIKRELNTLGTLDAVFCWLDLPLLSLIEYEKMLQFKESSVVVPLQTEDMVRARKEKFQKYGSAEFKKELQQKSKQERQLAKKRAKQEYKQNARKTTPDGGFWLNENVLISPYTDSPVRPDPEQ